MFPSLFTIFTEGFQSPAPQKKEILPAGHMYIKLELYFTASIKTQDN